MSNLYSITFFLLDLNSYLVPIIIFLTCLFKGNPSTDNKTFSRFPNIDHTKEYVRKDILH